MLKKYSLPCLSVFAFSFIPNIAFAAKGFAKAQSLLDMIANNLSSLAYVTVAIAILIVGYKMLFGGSTIKECFPWILGAIVIASAFEIADLMVN